MRIAFEKGIEGPDILTCRRRDGTTCTAELLPGSVHHDLAHFVVETTLRFQEGIWGMIENGATIAEYNLPNEERQFQISKEGYHAEFLATLVQSAIPSGKLDPAYVEMLRSACAESGLPFPELPPPRALNQLIALAKVLVRQWERLPAGRMMQLDF